MAGKTIFMLGFSVFVFNFSTANTSEKKNTPHTDRPSETTTIEAFNECGTTDKEYRFYDRTGVCYKFHTEGATWHGAEDTCYHEGGHLAIVNSQVEADFFVRNFPQGWSRAFLGFSWNKDSWVTIERQNLSEAGYEVWHYGEAGDPTKDEGDSFCGTMIFTGGLYYLGCRFKAAFICEKDPKDLIRVRTTTTEKYTSIEAQNECGTTDTGYTLDVIRKACYKLHPERKTWDGAEATCVREGGHLTVAWDRDDENFLYRRYPDGWSEVFLGIRQKGGSWVTSKGEALRFKNPKDEPNNGPGIELCSFMNALRDFDYIDCNRKIGFICEKDPNSQPLPADVYEVPNEEDISAEELLTESSAECGTEYKLRINTSSCYKFHTVIKTWDDALATCLREGGYLAVGTSRDDEHFYRKYLPPGFRSAWVSDKKISTIPKETDRIWSKHTLELSYTGIFVEGSPRTSEGNFICEKESSSRSLPAVTTETQYIFDTMETDTSTNDRVESLDISTEPITVQTHNECNTTDTGYKFLASTKKCYKVHTQKATWLGARGRCFDEGGDLAVINSQDEADFLITLSPEDTYPVYLGFHLVMGSWVTVQGQTLAEAGFENWNEGEPNNDNGGQSCGSMFSSGTFDDVSCNEELTFICERT